MRNFANQRVVVAALAAAVGVAVISEPVNLHAHEAAPAIELPFGDATTAAASGHSPSTAPSTDMQPVGWAKPTALSRHDGGLTVIASEAKQSSGFPRGTGAGLLRRYAPRNDDLPTTPQ